MGKTEERPPEIEVEVKVLGKPICSVGYFLLGGANWSIVAAIESTEAKHDVASALREAAILLDSQSGWELFDNESARRSSGDEKSDIPF